MLCQAFTGHLPCARDSVVNSTMRARGSEGLRLVLGGKDCLCKPLSVVSC